MLPYEGVMICLTFQKHFLGLVLGCWITTITIGLIYITQNDYINYGHNK